MIFPIFSKSSLIPSPFAAEVKWKIALLFKANFSPSHSLTFSFAFKSILFPTITNTKIIKLEKILIYYFYLESNFLFH